MVNVSAPMKMGLRSTFKLKLKQVISRAMLPSHLHNRRNRELLESDTQTRFLLVQYIIYIIMYELYGTHSVNFGFWKFNTYGNAT